MSQENQNKPEELEIAPDPVADEQQQQEFAPPAAEPEPEPDTKPEPTRIHMSPKDQERAEIAARFRKSRQDPQDVDYHGDHSNDPTQLYGAVAKEPEPEPEPEPEVKPQEDEFEELTVRREKVRLPKKEVLALAQKALAADSYFDDARKIYEDARRAAPSRPHPDETEPAPVARQDDADPDDARQPHQDGDPFEELVEKIQYGDKKEAAEALRTTLAKASQSATIETQWAQKINDDLARDTETYKEFAAKNSDIAQDENAVTVVKRNFIDGYREDLRKIGVPEDRIPTDADTLAKHHRIYKLKGQPVRSVGQLLEAAKTKFVEWKGGPAPKPQNQQQQNGGRPAVNVNRTERREAIPHQPSRAAVPQQLQRPQNAPASPDRSQVVQRMRQSRGQV